MSIDSAPPLIDFGIEYGRQPREYDSRLDKLGVPETILESLDLLETPVAEALVNWVLQLEASAIVEHTAKYPTSKKNYKEWSSNDKDTKAQVRYDVKRELTPIIKSVQAREDIQELADGIEEIIDLLEEHTQIADLVKVRAQSAGTSLEAHVRSATVQLITDTRRSFLQGYGPGYDMGAAKLKEVFGLDAIPLPEVQNSASFSNRSDDSNHRVWKVTAAAGAGIILASGTTLPAAANPNSSGSSIKPEASVSQPAQDLPLQAIVNEALASQTIAEQPPVEPEVTPTPVPSASSVEAPLFVPDTSGTASATESTARADSKAEPDKVEVSASATATNAEKEKADREFIENLAKKVNLTPEGLKNFSINDEHKNAFDAELHGEKIKEYKYFVGHWTAAQYDDGVLGAIDAMKSRDGNCCSSHLFMDKNGKVYQLVPFDEVAWHAMGANYESLGIEIEARDLYDYTPEQMEAFIYAYIKIWQELGVDVDPESLVGHEWVDKNLAGENSRGKVDMPTELILLLRPKLIALLKAIKEQSAQPDSPNEDTAPGDTTPAPPADEAPSDEPATPPEAEPANPGDQEPTTPPTEEPTPAPGDGTEQSPVAPVDPIAEATGAAQAIDESNLSPNPSSENNAQAEIVSEDLDSKFIKFKKLLDKAIDSKDLNAILNIEGIDSIALHDDDVEILISYRALYNAILANDKDIIYMLNDFDLASLTEEQRAAYTKAMNTVLTEDPSKDLSQDQKLAIAVINDKLGDYFEDDIAKAVASIEKPEADNEGSGNTNKPGKHEMSKNLYKAIKKEIDSIPNRTKDQKDTLLKYAVATYGIKDTDTRPEVIWGQAIFEGGWGWKDSALSRDHNNVFGIKASDEYIKKGGKFVEAPTWEYINGKKVYVPDAKFKSYDSLEDAFADRAIYLAGLDHYKDATKCADTIDGYIDGLLNKLDAQCNIVIPQGQPGAYSYATEPEYKSRLKNIIEKNHLPEIVKMFDEAKKREKKAEKPQRSHEKEAELDYMAPIAGNPKISCPLNGYSNKARDGYHTGVDYDVPIGTEIMSPEDGEVEETGFDNRAGYYIKIRFADDRMMIVGHLSKIKAKKGQKVARGEVIALSGNSGGNTTGAHAHILLTKPGVTGFPSAHEENVGDKLENPEKIW